MENEPMLKQSSRRGPAFLAPALVALIGCTGDVGSTDPPGPDVEALCEDGALPGPHPRLVRLTHTQYDNTVRTLLQLPDVTPSSEFIDDPAFAGFTNNAAALTVSERLARDYQRAAESLSDLIADPVQMAVIVPCDVATGDEACARDFVETFGRRAFRRALSTDEVDAYMSLYARGAGKFDAGTPFQQGIRHLVEGFLQSPKFLYRVELSQELDADKLIPLTGYEVATRLSYLLWNDTPDEDLLDAAESGDLDSEAGIEAHARRLLDDPRSVGPVDDFHAQWLQLAKYDNLSKDPALYPGFDASVSASMKEETQRFIRHVALEQSGSFEDLLLSTTTFVDDNLAAIYGLEGTYGSDFVEVELDPTQRAGLLTQPGFLASHAYTTTSSPIHRGVFVQRRVLCAKIADPPGDVDTTLPPFSEDIKTTKQAVEVHTSPEACVGCHSMINAPGYALESFDAVGAWRTTENGEPVDPTGTFTLDGAKTDVAGPIDLVKQVAESDAAGACYMRQWYRYGFAREETDADECTMDVLETKLRESGFNIKEMLVAFTLTKTFRYRIEEEVGQ
ncbi:MAG: DUF1592 domain-containing protein [Polyangiaceae bacterium]|nr:DUF1592 domain-containing protein [Polyangiaceae bacterium]